MRKSSSSRLYRLQWSPPSMTKEHFTLNSRNALVKIYPLKKNYARKGMKFVGTLNFLPCLLRNKPPVRVCVCPWWQSPFLNTKQISHWNRRRLNDHWAVVQTRERQQAGNWKALPCSGGVCFASLCSLLLHCTRSGGGNAATGNITLEKRAPLLFIH
jgi:hypothetical protein